jgi:Icc-related predicted phosphoesterase
MGTGSIKDNMKLQVVSDLHLEFGTIEIKNAGADVLVLSGDIVVADNISETTDPDSHRYLTTQRYRLFFEQVASEFKHVVYVAGNHEFYDGKWEKSLEILRHFLQNFSNVHFLEREHVILDDVVFMGGTLWTDMNKGDPLTLHATQDLMQDFSLIRNDALGYRKLRASDTVVRHRETLGYFKVLADIYRDQKIVMVTHHAPHQKSIHENFVKDYLSNGAYASDLSEFILDRPQIKLVTHGHMHNNSDYMIGDTRVVCNPRGYTPDYLNKYFNSNLVIEI